MTATDDPYVSSWEREKLQAEIDKDKKTYRENMMLGSVLLGVVLALLMVLVLIGFHIHTNNQTDEHKIYVCENIENSNQRRACLVGV